METPDETKARTVEEWHIIFNKLVGYYENVVVIYDFKRFDTLHSSEKIIF